MELLLKKKKKIFPAVFSKIFYKAKRRRIDRQGINPFSIPDASSFLSPG